MCTEQDSGAAAYQIRVRGCLDDLWSEWLDGLHIRREANGDTTLYGMIEDQAALYGILIRLRDLNLPLVSLQKVSAETGNEVK